MELFGISKTYHLAGGEVPALRDISLNSGSEFGPVRLGEFIIIRGPSGGGKTSLLNVLGTIDTPTQGRMNLFEDTIDFAKASDSYLASLRLRKIGFVFQSFNLLATMSAFENVGLPMSIANKLPAKERQERAKMLLRSVGLEDRMMHLPSELSGGEQQRVTIARALANAPELLLADEPTGDLDTAATIVVMDLLLRLNVENGLTIVMVTHNPDLETYADRVLFVSDGRIVGEAVNTEQTPLDFDTYVKYLNVEGD